jgi:hypothetical protein
MRALVLLLPSLFEVAQPELNIADYVDIFAMLDESCAAGSMLIVRMQASL